jgi:hypothetical protein
VAALPCDILVTPHPEAVDLLQRTGQAAKPAGGKPSWPIRWHARPTWPTRGRRWRSSSQERRESWPGRDAQVIPPDLRTISMASSSDCS